MTYFINAWLERPQPYLQVIHRESGRICVDFPAPVLEELCRNGDICPGDLNTSNRTATQEVVRQLFHLPLCWVAEVRVPTPPTERPTRRHAPDCSSFVPLL